MLSLDEVKVLKAVARNERRDPVAQFLAPKMLNARELTWVAEYAATFSAGRAAEATGLSAVAMLSKPTVLIALEAKVMEHEERSDLNAEYVREYLHDILEFHPTDYFMLDESGQWVIDPVQFRELPHKVKRLVEGVESKVERGRLLFTVKFLSKTAALAMAAKYSLSQKFEGAIAMVPWDRLLGHVEAQGHDAVDRRLAAFERDLKNGTPGAA